MGEIATSVTVMTGLSLVFAAVLAAAYRFLRVEEDPRLEVVEELLPGNNCGACGEPGCAAFAQRLVSDELAPGKCTVADDGTLGEIATFLEHDDLVPSLGEKTRCSGPAAARSDDADLGCDRLGRRLLRKIGDLAGHGVTPGVRFIDGPG